MSQQQVHALIIDDSRAMRAILKRILNKLDYKISEAENGLVALERLAENDDISICLVDWNMPEMNGYEFVKAVRADKNNKDIWLMMVTTETEMSRVVKAMTAGANEYVMKPFTDDVIIDKLRLLGLIAA
ncbi:MAG: two-component system chemotaxis response regulator CheY [Granulosicoccus sp.]|jgi:two-component system chemotaxis response regulator CheY